MKIKSKKKLARNRRGTFGISCRSATILPLLTPSIDMSETALSVGFGILQRDSHSSVFSSNIFV